MIENFQKITQEYVSGIKSMCDPLYVVLYGSSCKGTIKSDMDMFTIVKDSSQELIDAVAGFTIDFHRKYGLKEDYDVPYQSKTLYTYNDLEMAISAVSFIHKYDTFLIPPIVMKQDFLGSKEMKYRLLLNALTSNHKVLLGNENGDIKNMEKKCWETILRIILNQNGKKMFSTNDIYDTMVRSDDGSSEKGYLGYMEKNRNDMVGKISAFLDVFQKEGKITKNDGYYCTDKKWLNELIVKNIKARGYLLPNNKQKGQNKKIDTASNKSLYQSLSDEELEIISEEDNWSLLKTT